LLEGRAANAAPRQMRIVGDYIEAAWKKSMSIQELSEVPDVDVRNMFCA
jgi:hypothetical protein